MDASHSSRMWVIKALQKNDNDRKAAVEWIIDHPEPRTVTNTNHATTHGDDGAIDDSNERRIYHAEYGSDDDQYDEDGDDDN
jgi:hypothetical protein